MWPLNIGVYILPVSIRAENIKVLWVTKSHLLIFTSKTAKQKTLPINTFWDYRQLYFFPQLVYTSMQVIMSEACQETINLPKMAVKILQHTPNFP